jgi:hypothetical protein
MPELLHKKMADVYPRDKAARLCEVVQEEASRRAGAVEAIRGLVGASVLEPDGDTLKVLLKDNLAGMLRAALNSKSRASSWSK